MCGDIIGLRRGVQAPSALTVLVLRKGAFFLCDTHVTAEPDGRSIAEMTLLAAEAMRRFGIEPKAALLSHSSFGSQRRASARKMRAALGSGSGAPVRISRSRARCRPSSRSRRSCASGSSPIPGSTGPANLLVMPTMDAANLALGLLRQLGEGMSIGPILMGVAQAANIVTPTISVRGLVNMTAVTVAEAQANVAVT